MDLINDYERTLLTQCEDLVAKERGIALIALAFTSIDILCGAVAYWLDPKEKRYPVHLLVAQRFVYRQLMYWVVIRAVGAALRGPSVGWGKLERSGRVTNTAQ